MDLARNSPARQIKDENYFCACEPTSVGKCSATETAGERSGIRSSS